MNDALRKLDKRILKWIFEQGWTELRDIQIEAIPPILSGNQDVIISASTASGKTEAFFLPACSATINEKNGYSILYISPLKALINDQYRRLESLSEITGIPVTPWHGDVARSLKQKSQKNPAGIILITPESLESQLIRQPAYVYRNFLSLKYIVIDEFHAFIGTERGQQLLSLLVRLDAILQADVPFIPRVALSATLGNLKNVPHILRCNKVVPYKIIHDSASHSSLRFQIKGYVASVKEAESAEITICQDIYKYCRGGSHLVFANSRGRTESLSARLSDMCERNGVPNEFFPHHGSLSKWIREALESRLQKENLPTTAICTSTLELGIDIGKVDSVIQVTPPFTVSSLRQRLGRSGRRGTPAILRMMIAEDELHENSNLVDCLRLQLLQGIAIIRLLLIEKWYEPPQMNNFHFSTLLQQILATIAQWGSGRADQLYQLLCKQGSFSNVSVLQFTKLLREMGKNNLITQLSDGAITLGVRGESVTDDYHFYSVFNTPEEFRIIAAGNTLGTLPIENPVMVHDVIIFSGRRWEIVRINIENKSIYVKPAHAGRAPIFGDLGCNVHDRVRQEMRHVYEQGAYVINAGNHQIDYLDETARKLFQEGLENFQLLEINKHKIIEYNGRIYILPWLGDKIVNTICAFLHQKEIRTCSLFGVIELVEPISINKIFEILSDICKKTDVTNADLAKSSPRVALEKYDSFLPDDLWNEDYGQKQFDVQNTLKWLKEELSRK